MYKNLTACTGTDNSVTKITKVFLEDVVPDLFDPQYLCQIINKHCTWAKFVKYSALDFADELLATKPSSLSNNDYLNNLYASISG